MSDGSETDWAGMRLWALRGATTTSENSADQILDATEELLTALMERNSLGADRMVSCLFTSTDGLDAEFPAVAARRLGLNDVPLICAREIAVPGSLENVIRVMVHAYGPVGMKPVHVYLRDAVDLRSDLTAPQ
jgi:chorismate mutase